MDMNQLFIMATRKKFRFPYKGNATVEDMWDLSVDALDGVFKVLNAEFKKVSNEESLLAAKSDKDSELEAKIEIIKYIVKVKQEEAAEKAEALVKKAQKQKIMEMIASKKEAALSNLSVEELERMLADMQ